MGLLCYTKLVTFNLSLLTKVMYDVIIIGSGPAGLTAGIYTAKKNLKTLVLAKEMPSYTEPNEFQLLSFPKIQEEFENVKKQKSEYLEYEKKDVMSLEKNIVSFSLEVKSGALYYSKCVIIACGNSSTEFDLITHKNLEGKIKINANMETNIPGIFSAGNVTLSVKNDILTSAGQGAKAAISAVGFCKSSSSK